MLDDPMQQNTRTFAASIRSTALSTAPTSSLSAVWRSASTLLRSILPMIVSLASPRAIPS
jgi:hypothetical protein